jgi:Ca-activated chloride channel family protein
VAVGDPTTVGEEKLDEAALQGVARTTGGKYFFAGDREQLEGIYEELDRLEARKVETISHRPRLDLFHWPLGAGLVISMVFYAFRVGLGRVGVARSGQEKVISDQ